MVFSKIRVQIFHLFFQTTAFKIGFSIHIFSILLIFLFYTFFNWLLTSLSIFPNHFCCNAEVRFLIVFTAAWQSLAGTVLRATGSRLPRPRESDCPVQRSSHYKTLTHRSVLKLITDYRRAAANFEEVRCQNVTAARERHRRAAYTVITTTDFQCPHCSRLCTSELGLRSHLRVHKWVVEHKRHHRIRWTTTNHPYHFTFLFYIHLIKYITF